MKVKICKGISELPFPYGAISTLDKIFIRESVGKVFNARRINMNYFQLDNCINVHVYNATELEEDIRDMESCPWCDGKDKNVRPIRFQMVPCANSWHNEDAVRADKSKVEVKPQRLYAFWKYDMYPTQQCLGGEISKFGKNGTIERVGSSGYFYKPFKICLLDEGLEIQKKLDNLDAAYRNEWSILKAKYSKLHNDIIEIPE